jgi:hypothetical protein
LFIIQGFIFLYRCLSTRIHTPFSKVTEVIVIVIIRMLSAIQISVLKMVNRFLDIYVKNNEGLIQHKGQFSLRRKSTQESGTGRLRSIRLRYKVLLLIIFSMICMFVCKKFAYTFEFNNGEFFIGPVQSLNGKYTANSYYQTYGGAAGGVNVWVEITEGTGNKVRTIYYGPGKSNFCMDWLDDETLNITNDAPAFPNENRSIKLTIGKEIYDESGAACASWVMKDEFETCYERD